MLTDERIDRYARHILLREVGGAGQERLLASSVAVSGLGGVGGWLVSWLSLAGVGRLFVSDPAPVEVDDVLPLLTAGDVGLPRDQAFARAVPAFNPDTRVLVGPGEAGVLQIVCGLPPGGEAGERLWVHATGSESVVVPPGTRLCARCTESLGAAPSSATAGALAGSVAGAEALLHLLERGRRPRAALHFRIGEPFTCAHG